MILVIEKEKLNLSEEQQKALTAMTPKDRIYLICKKGDTIPVEIIPIISKINAKLEIVQISDENSLFEKGFMYGALSGNAGKEKVVILSEEKAPVSLDPNCIWNEGFGVAKPKRKPAQATKTTKGALTPTEQEIPKASEEKKPAEAPETGKRTRKSQKAAELFATEEYLSVAGLIGDKKAAFVNCILDASDGEIGYKMLLDVNFGRENGDKIWEATNQSFPDLRKMAKKERP